MPSAERLPHKPRRDDPYGHMVVQQNVEALLEQFETLLEGFLRGSATITPPAANVVVAHGLGSSAYGMMVVPTSDPGTRHWVSNKTSTSFQINLPAAPLGAVTFEWLIKED